MSASNRSPKPVKVVAYTCSLGGCDRVEDQLASTPLEFSNLRLVMFTDREIGKLPKPARKWTILPAKRKFELAACESYDWASISSQRLARMHKLLPHQLPVVQDADVSIWFDGNMSPKAGVSLLTLLEYISAERPIATYRHPDRTTVAQEVQACLRFKKDLPETLHAQYASYKEAGFPDESGLAETGNLVRKHTGAMRAFCDGWAFQVLTKSVRDQISFPFICWRRQQPLKAIPGSGTKNEWFEYKRHAKPVIVSV